MYNEIYVLSKYASIPPQYVESITPAEREILMLTHIRFEKEKEESLKGKQSPSNTSELLGDLTQYN